MYPSLSGVAEILTGSDTYSLTAFSNSSAPQTAGPLPVGMMSDSMTPAISSGTHAGRDRGVR